MSRGWIFPRLKYAACLRRMGAGLLLKAVAYAAGAIVRRNSASHCQYSPSHDPQKQAMLKTSKVNDRRLKLPEAVGRALISSPQGQGVATVVRHTSTRLTSESRRS